MNGEVVSGEPCKQACHESKLSEGQQCGSLVENTCTQEENHSQELTPQRIVLIMMVVISLLSCLCALTVWYFEAVPMQNIGNNPPV